MEGNWTLTSRGRARRYTKAEHRQRRQALHALALALATLALTAPGGVDYQGLHWCADPWCRAASRYEHADQYPATEPVPAPEPRAIVDLHLPEPDDQAA